MKCEHCKAKRATHIIYRHPMVNTMDEQDLFDCMLEERVCVRCAYYSVRRGEVDEYTPISAA